LEQFGLQYLSHTLPPWFGEVWLSQEIGALFNTKERMPPILRPLGMRNPLVKQKRSEVTDYLEPQQLNMSVAGGHILVHSIRMVLEQNPTFICVKAFRMPTPLYSDGQW
jgi:hypothetical protein